MARFIVADLTDPSSIPHELAMIVPHIPVPVQPLLLEGATTYTMSQDLLVYPWMLPTRHYTTIATLIAALNEQVIAPAEAKAVDLQRWRTRPIDGLPCTNLRTPPYDSVATTSMIAIANDPLRRFMGAYRSARRHVSAPAILPAVVALRHVSETRGRQNP